ncbi:hypothetical protein A0H76_1634 [Hepatospora eriocheir]|uniref:Uncharacterized protein n=1 Tax=Hepatospora eriocheir TaxID=1081669 RepID=A0A1X0QKJ7_9MICR|nr:hypothetical protein A0H76_1634 [Hepatospora eriocheir]
MVQNNYKLIKKTVIKTIIWVIVINFILIILWLKKDEMFKKHLNMFVEEHKLRNHNRSHEIARNDELRRIFNERVEQFDRKVDYFLNVVSRFQRETNTSIRNFKAFSQLFLQSTKHLRTISLIKYESRQYNADLEELLRLLFYHSNEYYKIVEKYEESIKLFQEHFVNSGAEEEFIIEDRLILRLEHYNIIKRFTDIIDKDERFAIYVANAEIRNRFLKDPIMNLVEWFHTQITSDRKYVFYCDQKETILNSLAQLENLLSELNELLDEEPMNYEEICRVSVSCSDRIIEIASNVDERIEIAI